MKCVCVLVNGPEETSASGRIWAVLSLILVGKPAHKDFVSCFFLNTLRLGLTLTTSGRRFYNVGSCPTATLSPVLDRLHLFIKPFCSHHGIQGPLTLPYHSNEHTYILIVASCLKSIAFLVGHGLPRSAVFQGNCLHWEWNSHAQKTEFPWWLAHKLGTCHRGHQSDQAPPCLWSKMETAFL